MSFRNHLKLAVSGLGLILLQSCRVDTPTAPIPSNEVQDKRAVFEPEDSIKNAPKMQMIGNLNVATDKEAVSAVGTISGLITISVSPDKIFYSPLNTILFSGKIVDSKGMPLSGIQPGIDDPVRMVCVIGPKTDKNGIFYYSVSLPSTAKGIYAFAFYYNNSKSYSAITVTPLSGVKQTDNRYKIPLGVSSSISSFDISTSVKITSNSGFPLASQDQLKNAANQVGTFMTSAGWYSLVDYVSNPANDIVSLVAIGCTGGTAWTGVGVAACSPLYTFMEEAGAKSIIAGTIKAAIDKTAMSPSDKLSWKNSVDEGSCYTGIIGLGPANSALDVMDAFGTGWTCGAADASVTTDPQNNKFLKILVTPTSTSSKQNVGAFVLFRHNTPPNKPSGPTPSNGAMSISTTPTLGWNDSDPDGDPLQFTVYFGTNTSAPAVSTGQSGMTYKPSTLQANKTYYWKIVATDGRGGITSGDWWSFTTKK